jgi:hypothetical protein
VKRQKYWPQKGKRGTKVFLVAALMTNSLAPFVPFRGLWFD